MPKKTLFVFRSHETCILAYISDSTHFDFISRNEPNKQQIYLVANDSCRRINICALCNWMWFACKIFLFFYELAP